MRLRLAGLTAAAILLALFQSAAADAQTIPTCSMVTPRGDPIGFIVWSGDNPSEVNFTATPGSVWPQRTLVGSTRNVRSNLLWFVIGDSNGFILTMSAPARGSAQRPATLMPRNGREAPVARAYGFCEERPVPTDAEAPGAQRNETGSDGPAFDPALWPEEDCALILSDGRRDRLRFTLTGRDEVQLQSPVLWSGRPVTAPVRWTESRGAPTGNFTGRDGLEGTQIMLTNGSHAAKLVHFGNLGDSSMPNASGYAICGYRAIVRMRGP